MTKCFSNPKCRPDGTMKKVERSRFFIILTLWNYPV